jgi:hypothetical protein
MGVVKKTCDSLTDAFLARPEADGTAGQILTLSSARVPAWASAVGDASSGERVTQELAPSVQLSYSLPTATSNVTRIGLDAGRHYWFTSIVTAYTPAMAVAFTQTTLNRVSVTTGGTASHLTPQTVLHSSGAGFSATGGVTGSTFTLTVSNTSGSTRTVQVIVTAGSARVVS